MLTNYLKLAWKVLLRHPFYTFITLFGISLTLTVLMVLTSFLDHLLGPHYPETNRDRSLYIQMMTQTDTAGTTQMKGPMSFRFLTDYVKSLQTPERVSISSVMNSSNAYVGSQKIKLNTKFTDADFWRVMAFDFLEGKPYNEQNIAAGDQVAVISDDFKKEYFGSASEPVVGKTIEIENVHYKVMGVVRGSPVTRFFTHAKVYFPYTAPKSNYQNTGFRGNYIAIVLAKDQSDFKAIQDEFYDRVSRIPVPQYEGGTKYDVLKVMNETYADNFLGTIMEGPGLRAVFLSIVGFIVFMLLGLPAINLVNVNVSRILERASEIGVRKAFGAPVRTLLWQFIIENLFITFIGGGIALVLTVVIIQLINHSGWIAYADLTINLTVFLVSVGVCFVFGILSGVLPALRMSKLKIVDALKG
ncbi:ABC transporter permease [Rhabdobacter roseus]|uniref:Putative ABC transport system permease protein n=1 Tax=Rhabdobacter roseus TaxID=1655419 RepID=A0A840TSV2_9BACT|nr:ABC transporter permease [Rhabdobacter roseus]MBB5287466.1 putative ABC transport system permease protein [Rhabdobacter roseus]